jgi:hypothetical protein
MGKMNAGYAEDLGRAMEGALGALNATVGPFLLQGPGNATLRIGTLVGAVVLERSFDGQVTWDQCTVGGTPASFTASASEVVREDEPGVWYRWRVSAFTSGAATARLSAPR